MKLFSRSTFAVASAIILLAVTFASYIVHSQSTNAPQTPVTQAMREDAYRQNNLGVALLEQYNHREAAEAFRRALKIDPTLQVANINLAIALYNVPETDEALRAADAAMKIAPEAAQPVYIAGLIAKAQNRTDDAVALFTRVLAIDPQDVGANVNLGQLYAQQRKYAEAITVFRKALAAEPYNTTAVYNLALALQRNNEREEGGRLLARFQELRQTGAGTSIGQNYLEQGRYAEAVVSTGAESDLVIRATPAVTFADASAQVLPAGVTGNRREGIPAGTNVNSNDSQGTSILPDGRLSEAAQRRVAAMHGGVTLFDYDGDGDLDLFEVAPDFQRLYRNDAGKYSDVTKDSGLVDLPTGSIGIGAVAGDYDNDGRADLFVLRYGTGKPGVLYHNEGAGKFTDRTMSAELAAYPFLSTSAAFVDVDHDGDLDIFIAGFADFSKPVSGDLKRATVRLDELAGAPNLLLRNNGDGKFTDITEAAKVAGKDNRAVAVIPTDYDNRRDVDLLIVNYNRPPVLFRNLRDRTFRDVAAEVGLNVAGRVTCAAAGDLNKDGFTDFFFGRVSDASLLALSDGQGKFRVRPIVENAKDSKTASGSPLVAIDAAQIMDYDADGLLDVIAVSDKGLRAWRNVGDGFVDVSERLLPANAQPPADGGWWARSFASGDIDADGDTDMILRLASGQLKVARNDGGNRNNSVRVQLAGRVSNRSAIAAKVEARAGSLWQKLETYSASPAPAPADVVFGLGNRLAPDAVRVIWTSGVVQAETDLAAKPDTESNTQPKTNVATRTLSIQELDRKPSSCPFLYTWNGERFEFITDMMGGGEMGAFVSQGQYNFPDPDEYVRIASDKLREHDGKYKLRITNELEEAVFMDNVKLLTVAHPKVIDIYPNEGLGNPTSSKLIIYQTANARPPVRAIDDEGRDVLPQIREVDRVFVEGFRLHSIRGYSEPHTLTLDLGKSNAKRTMLLMTAWTDYAFSSDNVAAAQQNLSLQFPALQVRDKAGNWKTVIDNIGLPVGRPQTVAVDLTGKFLTENREVRITTNARIYWDKIEVADLPENQIDSAIETTRLNPVRADLHWRGYSAEVKPDGREPLIYDYNRVKADAGWKQIPGRYTCEGDVRELLVRTDDMFVVSRPGDEMIIEFDANTLPALPKNWTRTFLLYVDGFSKEMDINSATPDLVAPLPFHKMKRYPYTAPEKYPDSPAHTDYLERYNTRVVSAPIRTLK
ncbi:MAG: FG-GAP-like repeat-containing protein [Pyrinomonadaceae bacterium MAG19_C2-C3]|nr:FG-GAP-like repeat-containing protein [Pyrinomonadaceae bacterium MAG19_C2-C3]